MRWKAYNELAWTDTIAEFPLTAGAVGVLLALALLLIPETGFLMVLGVKIFPRS